MRLLLVGVFLKHMEGEETMNSIDTKVSITPCEMIGDIDGRKEYRKLELTSAQKIQIGGLLQQAPAVIAADMMSKAYTIKFPEGIPSACHLMHYKAGGVGNAIQGADGKIVDHASVYELSTQAMVLNAFNAMSIASGQYFLAQINSELKAINKTVDQILEFLYGDKKAELMAEVSFTQYAYRYYNSIMEHKEQRIATISSLQEAKKVAMKDIEFYMSDLDSTVNTRTESDISALTNKMVQIKECLELSMQLYVMANLMEVYYSENDEQKYISGLEEDIVTYIGKCEKRILSCFSMLRSHIQNAKEGLMRKIDKTDLIERTDKVIDQFSKGSETELCKSLRSTLHARDRKAEYYISDDKVVYLKAI